MGKTTEAGVHLESDRFFNTPSGVASQLFYYLTRCGHYYCNQQYAFSDDFEVGRLASHRNNLILYICSGSMFISNAGQEGIAERGQVALLDCALPHYYTAREETEFLWLHIDGNNAHPFFEYICSLHSGRRIFSPPSSSATQTVMLQLLHSFSLPGLMDEARQSQLIYRLLCDLIILPQSQRSADDTDFTSKVVAFITQHLYEDLSIADIARHVSLSPSHVSRLFKARTGFSLHEFITLRRIDAAKELLLTTPLSVKQIAFEVGYHSEANFITSFSNKTGVTPAMYRRDPI